MNKKKFEVPYNFKDDYFDYLLNHKEYFDYIKFIYMPAYDEQYLQNTREESLIYNINYHNYGSYINIIKQFQSLNLDICILIQRNASLKLIEKYINEFNIKYFIINDDKLAKTLKKKYKNNINLTLSITRDLKYEDILNEDLSMYNEIVLMFWFNRHLQYIKKLPTKYKYSILTNAQCAWNCKTYKEHWWTKPKGYYFYKCQINKINTIKLLDTDLIYFNPYITTFKLVDRLSKSKNIFDSLHLYAEAYKNINNMKFDIEREKYFCLENNI